MNVLILGDGEEERAWARWFASRPEHRLEAAYPGSRRDDCPASGSRPTSRRPSPRRGSTSSSWAARIEDRGEALRRAAAEGLAIICLHPPGADSEPYYQVALSREETGAVVIPDLPLRLHPGVARMRQAIETGELGTFRGIRHESQVAREARRIWPAWRSLGVDVVRSLLGEIEALTASGDPAGDILTSNWSSSFAPRRAAGPRSASRPAPAGSARLTLNGSGGSLTLEYDPDVSRSPHGSFAAVCPRGSEEIVELGDWDPHEAILQTLVAARKSAVEPSRDVLPGPTLNDGTRAMELSEAVVRSLRRGRTIDLHYEAISEEASFKSIMTSTGCIDPPGDLVPPAAVPGRARPGHELDHLHGWLIPPVLVCSVCRSCKSCDSGIRPSEEPLRPDRERRRE